MILCPGYCCWFGCSMSSSSPPWLRWTPLAIIAPSGGNGNSGRAQACRNSDHLTLRVGVTSKAMAIFLRDAIPLRFEYPLLVPNRRQQKEFRIQSVPWFHPNGRPGRYWGGRPDTQQHPEQGPPFSSLRQHYLPQCTELRSANHLSQGVTIQSYARLPQVFSNATA